MQKLIPFDLMDLLNSEEAIQEYLSQVKSSADHAEIARAIIYTEEARARNKRVVESPALSLKRQSRDIAASPMSNGTKPSCE